MEFQELQNKIIENARRYGKEFGVDIDADFAIHKLYEEVGEFAQAYLVYQKKSRPEKHVPELKSKQMLAEELADIVGIAIVVSSVFDVDLESALKTKWLKHLKNND